MVLLPLWTSAIKDAKLKTGQYFLRGSSEGRVLGIHLNYTVGGTFPLPEASSRVTEVLGVVDLGELDGEIKGQFLYG